MSARWPPPTGWAEAGELSASILDPLMALGRERWQGVRDWLQHRLTDPAHQDRVRPRALLRVAAGVATSLAIVALATLLLAAAAAADQSIILGKRLSANHPAMTNAVGMRVGAVLLLVFSVGESWGCLSRRSDAWLTGEPITAQAVTGAALVMLGVWFGALSPGARADAAHPVLPSGRASG